MSPKVPIGRKTPVLPKVGKYGSVKRTVKGRTYDSGLEMLRAMRLQEAERDGKISDLRYQVEYDLIPSQKGKRWTVIKGKLAEKNRTERAVAYKADFVYRKGNVEVVEDTKGVRTAEYIIKRKLMLWLKGINIREVENPGEPI